MTNSKIYEYSKNILKPDMNNKLLKMYHISSKAIIPITITSILTHYYLPDYENNIHSFNILNFGYHSYFSTSSIITDYIKYPRLSQFTRVSSLNLHVIASIGFLQYIYFPQKNNVCDE